MPQYLIERDIAGAGQMGPEALKAAAQHSCDVLRDMGPDIHWVHSYVTGDKIYCLYEAANPDMIHIHAARSGFPANRVSEVMSVIGPATAG